MDDGLLDFEPRGDRNLDNLVIRRPQKEVRVLKTETIEEFLKRGGKIQRLGPASYKSPIPLVPSAQVLPQLAAEVG